MGAYSEVGFIRGGLIRRWGLIRGFMVFEISQRSILKGILSTDRPVSFKVLALSIPFVGQKSVTYISNQCVFL